MYVKIEFTDVSADQLPDLIHCFTPVHVETMAGNGYKVTTLPQGGPTAAFAGGASHWLLMQFTEFERLFNAETHRMRSLLRKAGDGADISEDESAEVKRFFDGHDPLHSGVAAQLAHVFGAEHAEWHEEFDRGARPDGVRNHTEGH